MLIFLFNRPEPATIEEWVEIALKQNLTIVQQQYTLEVARKGTNAARGKFTPSAGLNAEASRSLDYQNLSYS